MSDTASARWYNLFAAGAGLLMLVFARVNRLTFPYPWDDEARFYLPALWWAQHTSLKPENLHAPNGIFWVPDGFTLVTGLILKVFGRNIGVARTTCECAVAMGVMIFAIGFRKVTGSTQAGVLATLFLVTPPVVLAANMVRMEAIIFLLIATALLLHVQNRVVGAAALLFGSLLFHPASGLAAAGYALLIWATRRQAGTRVIKRIDWAILIVVALAFFLEASHTIYHLDLYRSQMSYQVARKIGSPLWERLMKPQGAILILSSVIITILIVRWRSRSRTESFFNLLPLTALPLGLLAYSVIGGEMAYDVYSLSVAPAFVFILVAAYVYRKDTGRFDYANPSASNPQADSISSDI